MPHFTKLLLAAAVTAAPALAQVPGEFQPREFGCPNVCVSQNDPVTGFTQRSLPNEYAYAVQMPSAAVVAGFSYYFETVSGAPATIQASLYRENAASPGTPDVNPVANATIHVDGPLGWYTAVLDTPVPVVANELFFISSDTNAVRPPDDAGGVAPPARSYWRRPPFGGTAWAATGIIVSPIYRVHCLGAVGGVTTLTSASVPVIGGTLTMDVGGAQAGFPSFAVIGAAPAVIDLGPFGATGCSMLTQPIAILGPVVTNPNGTGTHVVPVPNDPALAGAQLEAQAAVVAPGSNPFGLVTTNAASVVIGG